MSQLLAKFYLGYILGTPASQPHIQVENRIKMIWFYKEKQPKARLAANRKKSSSDEMGFKNLVFWVKKDNIKAKKFYEDCKELDNPEVI